MNKTKHNYLITLIRELEKEGNTTKLDNFILAVEDLLQMKYRLRNYFDYPITEPQYDELIDRAEVLLGLDHKEIEPQTLIGGGFATADIRAAGIDINTLYPNRINTVDSPNINMDFVNHVLSEYTTDQLTIDIIKQAAEIDITIDGVKVNKETADYIAKRIRQIQGGQNGIMSDQWIAFTAKQDIKKGDFVLIDEHDNQSVTPAKEMEVSPTTLEELFEEFELKKSQSDYKVETVNANTYKAYHYGAMFNLEDVKAS
jgi:hypothetical protein